MAAQYRCVRRVNHHGVSTRTVYTCITVLHSSPECKVAIGQLKLVNVAVAGGGVVLVAVVATAVAAAGIVLVLFAAAAVVVAVV